jgi:NAD(P)H-hydrate epimerase
MAAMAALRSGAGLVTVATPKSSVPVVSALGAEYMTLALDEDETGITASGSVGLLLTFDADVMAVGPGLGRSTGVSSCVKALVERSEAPLVLDADALNALAGDVRRLADRPNDNTIVVTPHAGEMARLMGLPVEEVVAHRLETARVFAATHRVHVVLKGHRTIVASPDGRTSINLTGNAGMATAGAGDVLTGIIAAWIGQLRDVGAAVRLAVYLHGLAGDLARDKEGEIGLIAGDITAHLGDAVRELTARRAAPRSQ